MENYGDINILKVHFIVGESAWRGLAKRVLLYTHHKATNDP